jgi:hypothetical protein
MAIVIPVAIEGMHIASRAGTVSERKGEAARVAQRLLAETLVTTNWNQAVQGGVLTEGKREFAWTMHSDPWTQDPSQNVIRQLSVEVKFAAQGQDYSVRMSTLVDSSQPEAGQPARRRPAGFGLWTLDFGLWTPSTIAALGPLR